jgi:acetyl-CoA C-acetyltransferase
MIPPHTPVLVGVGTVTQKEQDPARAREPTDLMAAALERAAEDAGCRALLARADSIRAPRGFWDYPDPGRLVAAHVGASRARTVVAEVGVLQTTLLGGAAADIAAGRADIVLVTGGEARYRALRASACGQEAPRTVQHGVEPDTVLRPAAEILGAEELRHGLVMPVSQYAVIENALRAAAGQSLAAHQREVAALWAAMSEVAAANPDAWVREPVGVDAILQARPLAFPYTKWHTSQWNVDQAAGLIFCAAETAAALGVPRERWVFPLAVADANHMVPLSARRHLDRSPGFAAAGARVAEHLGRPLDAVEHLELYSCFPSAVRVQLRALGIDAARQLTVTGGMAFAGGPLNNFVLQALAAMARVLRADPGTVGVVTAVSGMLTKQGVSAWSTAPLTAFTFDDVTAEAAAQTETLAVAADASGPATIVSYTVLYHGDAAQRALLLCDLPDGRRALAASTDPSLMAALTRAEWCGRPVRIADGGVE